MFRYTILTSALLGMGCVALSLIRPGWTTECGLDVWNLPELGRRLADLERQSEELTQLDEIVIERCARKELVVRDLLEERITLMEATARVKRINREPTEYPGKVPMFFKGRTENERYCRQVLQWVWVDTRDWAPSQAEEVLCRLEAELEGHLANHDGEVILPEY